MGIIYNCGSHYSAAGESWSHSWLHCFIYTGKLVMLLVSLYGHMSGHLAIWSCCLLGQLTSHFAFQCVQMKTWRSMCWKLQGCAPQCSNTSVQQTPKMKHWLEYLVRMKLRILDLDLAIAHRAVRWGVPAPIAGISAVPSAAAVAGPTPGPEEMIIKKAVWSLCRSRWLPW